MIITMSAMMLMMMFNDQHDVCNDFDAYNGDTWKAKGYQIDGNDNK